MNETVLYCESSKFPPHKHTIDVNKELVSWSVGRKTPEYSTDIICMTGGVSKRIVQNMTRIRPDDVIMVQFG